LQAAGFYRIAKEMRHLKSHSHAQGLLFALAGYMLLSMGDAIVKSMASLWPGTAIAALRYGFGALGLGGLLLVREGRAAFRIGQAGTHWARALAVSFSAVCFFLGVRLMPLGDATAITFIMPMLTALLSALFLKERVTAATLVASLFAFSGVLIILRPNLLDIGPAALLPLGSALGMACLILLNRKVAGTASVLAMQFIIALYATPILLLFAVAGHFSGIPAMQVVWPENSVIMRCAIVAVSASTAHGLIFMATTRASAATIAPMTYAQLLVAMTISTLVFDHPPDLTSIGGSALIVGAGLYLWQQARPKPQ
jgi:drug/metabolite transporter (DMT)-like permease